MEPLRRDWTDEELLADAKKYKTRAEWAKNSIGARQAAKKRGKDFVEQCCAHMASGRLKYTDAQLFADAKKYKTRTEWHRSGNGAGVALDRGKEFYEKCCAHMIERQRPKGFWSAKANCLASARKFRTLNDWSKQEAAAVSSAREHGWFDECTAHMTKVKNSNGFWTKARCLASARKFRTRTAWKTGDSAAFQAARKKGWHRACTAHMTRENAEPSKYTEAVLKKAARRFGSRVAWQKGDRATYKAARRRGLLDRCCAHMKLLRVEKYTDEAIIALAEKYTARGAWGTGPDSASYNAALKRGR
jgi:hypothetical protein